MGSRTFGASIWTDSSIAPGRDPTFSARPSCPAARKAIFFKKLVSSIDTVGAAADSTEEADEGKVSVATLAILAALVKM